MVTFRVSRQNSSSHVCYLFFALKKRDCVKNNLLCKTNKKSQMLEWSNVSWSACAFNVSFSCLWTLHPYQGYEERVFEAERSGDGKYWVEASQQGSKQDEFANVGLHRQTGQVETQRCQVLCVVQGVLTQHEDKMREEMVSAPHCVFEHYP